MEWRLRHQRVHRQSDRWIKLLSRGRWSFRGRVLQLAIAVEINHVRVRPRISVMVNVAIFMAWSASNGVCLRDQVTLHTCLEGGDWPTDQRIGGYLSAMLDEFARRIAHLLRGRVFVVRGAVAERADTHRGMPLGGKAEHLVILGRDPIPPSGRRRCRAARRRSTGCRARCRSAARPTR